MMGLHLEDDISVQEEEESFALLSESLSSEKEAQVSLTCESSIDCVSENMNTHGYS